MNEDYMPRKLDIVYKHIDSGNYKAAIKLCQKKDIQGWDITKALLAYCYVSLHRIDDALQVAREVKAKSPTDETVLNTLALVFKAARSEEDILGCYENALKIQPNNDVLIVELFCCYVKLRDSKRQQQLAMKLYKSTGNPKFVFWSVASMLQPNNIANNILQLGEKMISKVLYDGKGITPGSEELQLYIEVICRQHRHADALTELNKLINRAKQHPTELFKDEMDFKKRYSSVPLEDLQLSVLKCKLLQEDKTHRPAASSPTSSAADSSVITEIIKSEILQNYPDHWDGHTLLIQQIIQTFPIQTTTTTTTTNMSEEQQQAVATIVVEEEKEVLENEQKLDEDFTLFSSLVSRHQKYLQQQQALYPSSRGPLLAQLLLLVEWDKIRCQFLPSDLIIPNDWKLCKMQTEQTCTIYIYDELVNLLYFYYHTFGDKQCCFSDMVPYLHHLKTIYPESAVTLFQRFSETASSLSSLWDTGTTEIAENVTVNNNNICRFVKVNQILNFLQDDVSEASEAIIRKYPLFLKIFLSSCENLDFAAKDDSLLLLSSAFSRRFSSYALSVSSSFASITARSTGSSVVNTMASMSGGVTVIPNVTEIATARKFINSIQTVLLCKVGLQAHPQTFGYMLTLLEPYRQLVVGMSSILAFNRLGVKYVQTDSMSYLLLPAMLESGMLAEAMKMMKSILGFHSGVSRETMESICHCFHYGNYMKSLELWKFIDKCQNSMQLALAKAELPLLQLAQNLYTVEEATENLRDCVFSKPSGSQADISNISEMVHQLEAGDNSDINTMTLNMDYELLPLAGWSHEKEDKENAASIRKQQYVYRIQYGRLMQRLLLCLLDNEGKKACAHIDTLVTLTMATTDTATSCNSIPSTELTDQKNNSHSSTEPSIQVVDSINCIATSSSPTSSSIIWSQAIKAGDSGDGFQTTLFKAISSFLYACSYWEQYSTNIFNQEAGLPFDNNDDIFAAFTSYQVEFLSAIQDLTNHLFSSEYRYFAPLPSFISTSDPKVNKENERMAAAAPPVALLLQPSWIQKISAFQLSLGNWGPLLISFLITTLTAHLPEKISLTTTTSGGSGSIASGGGNETGKKKKGNKNKIHKSEVTVDSTASPSPTTTTTTSTTQINIMAKAMKDVFSALATSIDKIKVALTVELQVNDDEKIHSLTQYLSYWSQRLEMENRYEDGLSIFYQTEYHNNNNNNSKSNSNNNNKITIEPDSDSNNNNSNDDDNMIGSIELLKALKSIKTELVESHRVSCDRLRDCLRDKLALIPNIIAK